LAQPKCGQIATAVVFCTPARQSGTRLSLRRPHYAVRGMSRSDRHALAVIIVVVVVGAYRAPTLLKSRTNSIASVHLPAWTRGYRRCDEHTLFPAGARGSARRSVSRI